ncbi:MFS transporter [Cohnella nanjingensis]|uniref:MFS transporter n=1 Tax=Cohnella nanjingensis TaxID=1387779 RepID=A0A7X0RTZ5_9BACL|nr:MFS transporter [Cohnella nanjingensis]MBB6673667.1 MFS transporter [Cohnella nanjingensis]
MNNRLIYALAFGGFLLGTVESIVAGIIEMISDDLHVSLSSVGWLVTSFALGFGIGSPILIALMAKLDRKRAMLIALALFAAGNILVFPVHNFPLLLALRLFTGCGAGAFIAIAFAVAMKLVDADKGASAIGIIATGITSSLVIGIPIGTLLSKAAGWRFLFLAVGLLALILGLILARYMPRIVGSQKVPLTRQFGVLKNKAVITAVLVSFFLVFDYGMLLTYLTPFIQSASRMSTETISLILLVAGLFSMASSRLSGFFSDKWGSKLTIYTGLLVQVAILVVSPVLGHSLFGMIAVVLIWMASLWSTTPALQFYLVSLSPQAPDIAQSVNLSFFQFGLMLGPLLGGVIIRSSSASNLGWSSGIVALIALVFAFLSFKASDKVGSKTYTTT